MKYPTNLILLFLIIFSLLAYSCESNITDDKNNLIIGIEANPTNLDPRYATDAYSARIDQLIFNSLLRVDNNFKLVPDLAERWDVTDDLSITVYLKKGIYFHHGTELTSVDVKFTFDSILDPANKSPKRSGLEEFSSIDIIDRYTVRFHLKRPFAPALATLAQGIVPKDEAIKWGDDFSSHLSGTGPFRVKEINLTQNISLIAFNKYFEGRPSLDEIRLKIIPDSTVRVLELEHGDIDLLVNSVEPDMIPRLRKNPQIQIITSPGINYSYMGFNMEDKTLKILNVRKAIAHSINRNEIIKYILKGFANPATGVIAPQHWSYEKNVKNYKYNPELAKTLLDEAGFTDPDKDGPLPRLKLSYKTSTNELRKRIASVIQEQLSQVGIAVDIHSNEWGTFFGDIKKGNFQLYTLTWVGITEPDIYYYIFNSKAFPPSGANRGRYFNPEIDSLTDKARFTISHNVRLKLYSSIQRIVAEDIPYVSLWYTVNVAAARSDVKNFRFSPAADFFCLKNVEIKRD